MIKSARVDMASDGSLWRLARAFTFVLMWALALPAWAQAAGSGTADGVKLEVVQLTSDTYMIAGAGGNIVVNVGAQGVAVVDTGSAAAAPQVLAAIQRLTSKPIHFLINTSPLADHVGGNQLLAAAGSRLGQPQDADFAQVAAVPIIATLGTLTRMSGDQQPEASWPTETVLSDRLKTIYFNGQGIEVKRLTATSDADAIVLFRRSDVIAAGDVLDLTGFPRIDIEHGGSIQGEIDALNDLIDLAIPNTPMIWMEGGTIVVPGHGRACQQAEVVEYRDMLSIIRDRVQDQIKRGKSLAQVKASNPTAGYRSLYGSDEGPWTTDQFVEAVYRSLKKPPAVRAD